MGRNGSENGNGSRGQDFRVPGAGSGRNNVLVSLSITPEGPVTPRGQMVNTDAVLADINRIASLGGPRGYKGQPRKPGR